MGESIQRLSWFLAPSWHLSPLPRSPPNTCVAPLLLPAHVCSPSFLSASGGAPPGTILRTLHRHTWLTTLTLLIETAKVDVSSFLPALHPLSRLTKLHVILHVDFSQLTDAGGASVQALTQYESYSGLASLRGLARFSVGYVYGTG